MVKLVSNAALRSDTLWLSQSSICELYGKAKSTISEHIRNIFTEGELVEDSVVRFTEATADDAKQYNVKYFNLSMILAIGYRVRSVRGTQFRQWATQTLEQYLIKGFVMDDERLKNPPIGQSVVPVTLIRCSNASMIFVPMSGGYCYTGERDLHHGSGLRTIQ